MGERVHSERNEVERANVIKSSFPCISHSLQGKWCHPVGCIVLYLQCGDLNARNTFIILARIRSLRIFRALPPSLENILDIPWNELYIYTISVQDKF